MNNDLKNKLLKKFYEGNTTIQEEEQLLQLCENNDKATKLMLEFSEKHMNDKSNEAEKILHDFLPKKKIIRKKLYMVYIGIAASAAILILALNLFVDKKPPVHPLLLDNTEEEYIIYQDENFKIYFD